MVCYFQFEKKFQSTRTDCICGGLEEFKERVKGFQNIQDIRGNVQKLPNSVDKFKKRISKSSMNITGNIFWHIVVLEMLMV